MKKKKKAPIKIHDSNSVSINTDNERINRIIKKYRLTLFSIQIIAKKFKVTNLTVNDKVSGDLLNEIIKRGEENISRNFSQKESSRGVIGTSLINQQRTRAKYEKKQTKNNPPAHFISVPMGGKSK